MFNMDVDVGPLTTSESYDAKSNHNGTAVLGPCSFSAASGEFRLVSGGWYGEIHQPEGRASGQLDCRMSADITIRPAAPDQSPPPLFYPWSFVATRIQFDPFSETASYGWTMGTLLTWLDTGAVREFRLSHTGYCAADDLSSQPYDCNTFHDDSGGLVGGSSGRVHVDLWIDLFFELREEVPAPSTLSLTALAIVPGGIAVMARRRCAMRAASRGPCRSGRRRRLDRVLCLLWPRDTTGARAARCRAVPPSRQ